MKFRSINLNSVLGIFFLLYPVIVFLSVVVFDVEPNRLSFFIIGFALLYFVIMITNKDRTPSMFISPIVLFLIGIVGLSMNYEPVQKLFPNIESMAIIKFYPVLANIAYLIIFITSIFFPPTLVYDVSLILDKTIKGSAAEAPMKVFCRNASIAWCVFFVLDSVIACLTIFTVQATKTKSDAIWAIYNGGITYVIMGIIFLIQLTMGKMIIKKAQKAEAYLDDEEAEAEKKVV